MLFYSRYNGPEVTPRTVGELRRAIEGVPDWMPLSETLHHPIWWSESNQMSFDLILRLEVLYDSDPAHADQHYLSVGLRPVPQPGVNVTRRPRAKKR